MAGFGGDGERPADYYRRSWQQAQHDRLVDPAECAPDDVDFTITWRQITDEVLAGSVRALNISSRVWRITGKPTLVRVTAEGRALPLQHVVTAEGRFRGWVLVHPGGIVDAPVSITGWDGTPLADYVLVRWPGGDKPALVLGPTHPSQSSSYPMTTSSSWFAPPKLSLGPPLAPFGRADDEPIRTPPPTPGPAHLDEVPDAKNELANFVMARLDASEKALLELHRARCGTPPTAFALDANGQRHAVPPCLCDMDIRRSTGAIASQRRVVPGRARQRSG